MKKTFSWEKKWKSCNNITGLWNTSCITGYEYVIGCNTDSVIHEYNDIEQISRDKVKPFFLMAGLSSYKMLLQAFCLGRKVKNLSWVHRKCWSWMYKWAHFNP